MNKLVVLGLVIVSGMCGAMQFGVSDAAGARDALKGAATRLRDTSKQLEQAQAKEANLELEYDKKSKNWKSEIKSVSDRLISQMRQSHLIDVQNSRDQAVAEALQKMVVLFRQIEGLQRELSEQKSINQEQKRINTLCMQELETVKKNLDDLAKSSKENKALLEREVKSLQGRYNELVKLEQSVRQNAHAQEAALVEAEKEFTVQLAQQEQVAREAADKALVENQRLIDTLELTKTLNKTEIGKLRSNMTKVERQFKEQRARANNTRANNNWVELQKLKKQQREEQQKPAQTSAVTRFFNWLRGKR